MAKSFSNTERSVLSLCKPGTLFTYNNSQYEIIKSGKPMPTDRGECKTDIYILAKKILDGTDIEFKISIKQYNAHFLENKMTFERAIQIFGEGARDIITKSIIQVKKYFEDESLVFFERKGQTQAKSIKLGWRFELFSRKQGDKSEIMLLTQKQKIDVFAGTNLSNEKKNSRVNGEIINNSGIANFMLIIGDTVNIAKNLDDYIEVLIPIEDYAAENEIYFGCKAINYRAGKSGNIKWEGDRSLSVFVDWVLKDNKLKGTLIYNKPLEVTAHKVGHNLIEILHSLGITEKNFDELSKYFVVK